jgi:hypothetical protein
MSRVLQDGNLKISTDVFHNGSTRSTAFRDGPGETIDMCACTPESASAATAVPMKTFISINAGFNQRITKTTERVIYELDPK